MKKTKMKDAKKEDVHGCDGDSKAGELEYLPYLSCKIDPSTADAGRRLSSSDGQRAKSGQGRRPISYGRTLLQLCCQPVY